MITKSPQYVRDTAAGKSLSAWVVLRTGRFAGDVAAKISAHYSNSRVLVNVSDVAGFRSATGDDLENALSYLEIDGVKLYGHAQIPDDAGKWLKKAAAIYKRHALPELPDLGIRSEGMPWAEYVAECRKRATPEYLAVAKLRGQVKEERAAAMLKLTTQVEGRGMQFANGGENGPQSIHFVSGLDRLAFMGYRVINII